MKIKRIATLLLAVCLLLSMGAVPVLAEDTAVATKTVMYDFDYSNYTDTPTGETQADKWNAYIGDWGTENYGETINSVQIGCSSQGSTYPLCATDVGLVFSPGYVGDWAALKIKSPGAGTYSLSLKSNYFKRNTTACDIYLFAATDDAINDIASSLTDVNKIVTGLDLTKGEADGGYIHENVAELTFNGDVTDYIVVFKATLNCKGKINVSVGSTSSAKNTWASIRLEYMTLTKVNGISESEVAQEISNAPIGSTIKLNAACNADDAAITVKNGATLDLNGQALTASSLTAFGTGSVIDSSADKTGLLKVANNKLKLNSYTQFPLYDSDKANDGANSGWKFYTATTTDVDTTSVDSNSNKYRKQLTFDNNNAYTLIANGDSGLKIGAKMSWTVGATDEETGEKGGYDIYAGSTFDYAGWANALNDGKNVAITVTVNGIDLVDPDSFSLKLIIANSHFEA